MNRRWWLGMAVAMSLVAATGRVLAADEAPDALIKRLSSEILAGGNARDAGDASRIMVLVDTKIMPNVDFARMTASAVGRTWRQASPEQQSRLQEEFKALLVRTYAGALTQVKDQTVSIKPSRAAPEDTEVIVRTAIKGQGSPIHVDYRLEKSAAGWRVYDLNVMGVWLVEAYRGQFAAEINAKGIDGLIAALAERNKANVRGS